MAEPAGVVVVGAGQAGLAASHELAARGVHHVVLERGRVGETWRGRWDTFCLVTPNWTLRLPGYPYDGEDPDGYLLRDDIVGYLERYAGAFEAPVRTGVDVTGLEPLADGTLQLRTTAGDLRARAVVVATGAYQRPYRPAAAAGLPPDLPAIGADEYRNPASLAEGPVLIVGSGQTGCQIAEELLLAGREVFLSCGRAPWFPRRAGGRDLIWWFVETGFMDVRVEDLPGPEAKLFSNPLATGRDGGHDLHLRTLQRAGATLVGRFAGAEGHRIRFDDDLGASVAWGDERYLQLREMAMACARERGYPVPDLPDPPPFRGTAPESIATRDLGVAVFAGGYRPEYASWIGIPDAFDPMGFPVHAQGRSVAHPGLFFVGVHFLRTRKSSLFLGVGEDAAIVAAQVAGHPPPPRTQ